MAVNLKSYTYKFLAIFFCLGISLPGCKESEPAPRKKSKSSQNRDRRNSDDIKKVTEDCSSPNTSANSNVENGENRSGDTLRGSENGSNDGTNNSDNTNGSNNDSGSGLSLVGDLSWEGEIKDISDRKCVGCHSGNEYPDMRDFEKVKSAKSAILAAISGNSPSMPKNSELSSGDMSDFSAWLNGDMAETSADNISNGDSNNSGDNLDRDSQDDSQVDNNYSDCETANNSNSAGSGREQNNDDDDDDDDTDDNTDVIVADWDDLINPDEFKKCKDKDKLYDRAKKECHKASIASSYGCDWNGLKSAFQGVSIDSELDRIRDDEFEIDQCGTFRDDPIIFFIKKSEDGDTMSLKIRKLCKTGSDAC
jgi:hypothetical protein